jgi:salicylate biosynthesis isochorismate synthase/menaquinone-specific isochorismate synthase
MSGSANRQDRWFGRARPLEGVGNRPVLGQPTLHWRRPDGGEAFSGQGVAGILSGRGADSLNQVQQAQVQWIGETPDVPGPWFGGLAFDGERVRGPEWAGFGEARWILPRVAVAERAGRRFLLAFARAADAGTALRELDAVLETAGPRRLERDPFEKHAFLAPRDERNGWDASLERALEQIRSGSLQKVVLARRVRAALPVPVEVSRLVESLAARHRSCAIFALAGADGAWFVGATPETLLRLSGHTVQVDALAGTLATNQLAPGDKELREHAFVVDAAKGALLPLAARISCDPHPVLVRLRHLVHLRTNVEAKLHPDVPLAQLVRRLHPTPAVGGTPRNEALCFIRENEPFDRGWYAGAVGWVGDGAAHLCVAIRSALFRGREAWIYAGAGIVAGSSPDLEWDETERKARAVLEALEDAS